MTRKEETPLGASSPNIYHYFYDTEAYAKGKLIAMTGGPNNMTTSYKYDNHSRNYKVTETFDGQTFVTSFGFDSHSRINKITYPSGYVVNQTYDELSSALKLITDGSNNNIWELTAINNVGEVASSKLGTGNHFTKERTWTDLMSPDLIKFTSTFSPNVWENKWDYEFNEATGNMASRQNILTQNNNTSRNLKESFGYDSDSRLTNEYIGDSNTSL